MDAFRNGRRRSFPASPDAFPSVSDASPSVTSFALSSFLSVHPRRRLILISTFIVGLVLTFIMKREAFLWLLSSAAGAAPLLEWEQGSTFDYPGLRFKSDNTFKISMFNDLHLGDGDRKGSDEKTIGVMKSVLDKEGDTDLVVINGDLTSCEWLAPQEATLAIDKIITPLIERGLPFATTFGNHDMSKTCNPRDMSQHIWDMGNKNGRQLTWTAWSVFGDPNVVGTSNYYIPVYSNTGGGNPELKMLLWFFDSKGGKQFNTEGPVDDWVNEKVRCATSITLGEHTDKAGDLMVQIDTRFHSKGSWRESHPQHGIRPHSAWRDTQIPGESFMVP